MQYSDMFQPLLALYSYQTQLPEQRLPGHRAGRAEPGRSRSCPIRWCRSRARSAPPRQPSARCGRSAARVGRGGASRAERLAARRSRRSRSPGMMRASSDSGRRKTLRAALDRGRHRIACSWAALALAPPSRRRRPSRSSSAPAGSPRSRAGRARLRGVRAAAPARAGRDASPTTTSSSIPTTSISTTATRSRRSRRASCAARRPPSSASCCSRPISRAFACSTPSCSTGSTT